MSPFTTPIIAVATALILSGCGPMSDAELEASEIAIPVETAEPIQAVYTRMSRNARSCHSEFEGLSSDLFEASGTARIEYLISAAPFGAYHFAKVEMAATDPAITSVLISAYHRRVREDLVRWARGGTGC